MPAYYNEHDPFAAAWLRELVKDGLIAPGDVDERSIVEVQPDDLKGYTQCHFFAGIGGWSAALRLAGWDDARPVWTGSCPCQPFSSAGKQEGHADPRHLWPEWFRLLRECKPAVVFGEQVAAAIGWGWLDLVSADLEGCGYAVGAAVLPAASVGAPHKRDRLWFVADSRSDRDRRRAQAEQGSNREDDGILGAHRPVGFVGHASGGRTGRDSGAASGAETGSGGTGRTDGRLSGNGPLVTGPARGVADPEGGDGQVPIRERGQEQAGTESRRGSRTSPWVNLLWLPCRDGKARPTQPGLFPLAHGVPHRVGTLRGAGNAIVPQVAAALIEAYLGVTT